MSIVTIISLLCDTGFPSRTEEKTMEGRRGTQVLSATVIPKHTILEAVEGIV